MSRGTHCISSNIDSTKNADHIFEMPESKTKEQQVLT